MHPIKPSKIGLARQVVQQEINKRLISVGSSLMSGNGIIGMARYIWTKKINESHLLHSFTDNNLLKLII